VAACARAAEGYTIPLSNANGRLVRYRWPSSLAHGFGRSASALRRSRSATTATWRRSSRRSRLATAQWPWTPADSG